MEAEKHRPDIADTLPLQPHSTPSSFHLWPSALREKDAAFSLMGLYSNPVLSTPSFTLWSGSLASLCLSRLICKAEKTLCALRECGMTSHSGIALVRHLGMGGAPYMESEKAPVESENPCSLMQVYNLYSSASPVAATTGNKRRGLRPAAAEGLPRKASIENCSRLTVSM